MKVYFRDQKNGGTAILILNGVAHESKTVSGGWFRFDRIQLEAGDLALRSILKSGEAIQQAWQVEISRA